MMLLSRPRASVYASWGVVVSSEEDEAGGEWAPEVVVPASSAADEARAAAARDVTRSRSATRRASEGRGGSMAGDSKGRLLMMLYEGGMESGRRYRRGMVVEVDGLRGRSGRSDVCVCERRYGSKSSGGNDDKWIFVAE